MPKKLNRNWFHINGFGERFTLTKYDSNKSICIRMLKEKENILVAKEDNIPLISMTVTKKIIKRKKTLICLYIELNCIIMWIDSKRCRTTWYLAKIAGFLSYSAVHLVAYVVQLRSAEHMPLLVLASLGLTWPTYFDWIQFSRILWQHTLYEMSCYPFVASIAASSNFSWIFRWCG